MPKSDTQRARATAYLQKAGIARLYELNQAGITGATVGRMVADGEVNRLGRGLYQLVGAPVETYHDFAESAKRVPGGVICLVSALTYYGLTDQLPRCTWMAVRKGSWTPKESFPLIRVVRFTDAYLSDDVHTVQIENVPVKIFGVAKTIADCFRHRRTIGRLVALEGLQETLWQRKATPAEIMEHAIRGGVGTVIAPYLDALIANNAYRYG